MHIDRWITYGTQSVNRWTTECEAVDDAAGNRSPASHITLHNQAC